MATYLAGTIGYMPVVKQINRKFTIRANKSKNQTSLVMKKGARLKFEPAIYMGAGTRVRGAAGIGSVSKNYMFMRERNRQSVYTTAEVENWSLFERASKGRNVIVKDLMQLSQVQILMQQAIAQNKPVNGVYANGYTFRGWIFAVQFAGCKNNAEYDENKFPKALDA